MRFALTGLMILAGVCIIRLVTYRRWIREIHRHLAYIRKSESNLLLRDSSHIPCINELADEINALIKEYRGKNVALRKQENIIKETITNLSHDIRTPITALDGYFQLLTEAQDEETRQRYIAVTRNRLAVTNDMLEELFTFAKLQNNMYQLESERILVNSVICHAMFDFYEDFKRKGLEPVIDIEEEELYAQGNEKALQRVLHNIIRNALIHGNRTFHAVVQKSEEGVLISIRNDFPADPLDIDIERVFERFYMADQARTKDSTGLGLSIAKELVEKMNGRIWAEVEEREFIITIQLPAAKGFTFRAIANKSCHVWSY